MIRYWIWLTTLRGVSLKSQRNLLRYFDTPEDIFLADRETLDRVESLSSREKEALGNHDLRKALAILEDCRKEGIHILTWQDAVYPERLKNIDTPPLVLYYKGKLLAFDTLPVITVVGSRKASGYGLMTAKRLGYQLGNCGAAVVSGAAKGIDSLALEGALSAGAPVAAVLGNGLDIVYPAEARALYQDIARYGCLISEYPPGTPPLGSNFPRRNRIMSGLALGVLVVEAARKSGSLITADYALEQGRAVYAVPGNIGLTASEGSNDLLREGAQLATSGWDILQNYVHQFPELLKKRPGGTSMTLSPRETPQPMQVASPVNVPKPAKTSEKPAKTAETVKKTEAAEENRIDNGENRHYIDLQKVITELTPDQKLIVEVLAKGQRHVDDIIAETALPPARVLSALTLLEVYGYVTQQPGKRFDSNLR